MPQITPLVSNSLGADTQTHTTHTYRRPHQSYFKKPGVRWPAAGGLKTIFGAFHLIQVYVCMC